MQNNIDNIQNSLSDYMHHQYSHLSINVEISSNTIVTLEQREKSALCQFNIIITSNYDKSKPLTLEYLRYDVRISDNGRNMILQGKNTGEEADQFQEKIAKWIVYILG
jgi:hypothetical protein